LATPPIVQFRYLTGLKRRIFRNVRLVGSWDAAGVASPNWSETPMTEIVAEDGCPAFVATVKFDRAGIGHAFAWTVRSSTPAVADVCGVAAEVDEADRTDRIRSFELRAPVAAAQVEEAQAGVDEPQHLEEIIADKGYHSNQTMVDLDAVGVRSYVAEPDRGRRDWSEQPEAQAPVYGNRRRMRGRRGRRLMRRRGETIERSFAHLYDTGGMRRTHLRGHTNILKRLLIHAGGFNLGLVMRHLIGLGTPRGLQGRLATVLATLFVFLRAPRCRLAAIAISRRLLAAVRARPSPTTFFVNSSAIATCTPGC
jgi:transposase